MLRKSCVRQTANIFIFATTNLPAYLPLIRGYGWVNQIIACNIVNVIILS